MSVYTEYYGDIYGGGGVAGLVLGLKAELYTGQWTDITDFVYQRDPVKIQLGRQDESSQISPASCSMTLNNRDGRFTTRNPVGAYYGTIGQNTPFRLSVPAYLAGQGTALLFADDSQSYVSCPDSDALQLTGDFDVRIDMWLDDYQPCTLAGKWGGDTDLQAWCLVLNGDGTVSLYWCSDGTVSFAQSTAPLPYLGRVMVRAFFAGGESDLVTVRFYTAPTMSGSQTQLGDPTWGVAATGFAQAAATQPVQAGYVDGFLGQGLPTGNSGCLGRVYELQLYNATPDLVADPVFSAQSAGATSFTDGEGNTWTLEGTSALDDRCYRFHGEMSAWPKAADPSSRDAYSQATASGVLRRLNQGTTPVLSVMRRGIVSYIVPTWGVAAYWPCEDAQGSTQIASGLPGGTPMSFSGVPSFQGQPGSPSADSIFACSAQLVQPASSSWTGPVHGSSSLWGTFLLLAIPSGGLSGDVAALAVVSYSDGNSLTLGYTTADGGTLTLTMTNFGSVDGTTGVNGMGLLAEILTGSGDSTLNTLALGAAAGQSFEQGEAPSGSVTSVVINPAGVNLEGTEIGHVWVSADPPAIDSLADYLNAFSGETAAYRVARLCSENGLNSRIYGAPGISVPMGAQSIDTLANLFQYCEATDMGMLYEPRETAGMGYRTSASMCNQSPAVTADYSMQQVSQGFADTADDLLTLNDVIASNVDGSSAEQTLTAGRMSVAGAAGRHRPRQQHRRRLPAVRRPASRPRRLDAARALRRRGPLPGHPVPDGPQRDPAGCPAAAHRRLRADHGHAVLGAAAAGEAAVRRVLRDARAGHHLAHRRQRRPRVAVRGGGRRGHVRGHRREPARQRRLLDSHQPERRGHRRGTVGDRLRAEHPDHDRGGEHDGHRHQRREQPADVHGHQVGQRGGQGTGGRRRGRPDAAAHCGTDRMGGLTWAA